MIVKLIRNLFRRERKNSQTVSEDMSLEKENELLKKEIQKLRSDQERNKKFRSEFETFISLIDDCEPILRQHCRKDFLQKHKLMKKENLKLVLDSDSPFLEMLLENMPRVAKKRTEQLIANGRFGLGTVNTIIVGPLLINFHGMQEGSVRIEISNLRQENLTTDRDSGKIVHFNREKDHCSIEGFSNIHQERENIV